jgi:tRNA pseudouridine55 synthase
MNGLLLVNKPVGITSFDVIRQLRRLTGVKKIGHAGTLDPLASGLMLMLFGTACKQAQTFSKLDKTYLGELTLGFTSTTGDAEGEKLVGSGRVPTLAEIEGAAQQFKGEITQTPSQYSAIKINGTEAYKLARAGKTVEMPSRQVTINALRIVTYDYPKVTFIADVSSGTYIRSLAADIGEVLGTGAYLSGLQRTVVGEYQLAQAVDLTDATPELVAQKLFTI